MQGGNKMSRPQGRQKNITGQGKSLERRGSGLGTGPVGRDSTGVKIAKFIINQLLFKKK